MTFLVCLFQPEVAIRLRELSLENPEDGEHVQPSALLFDGLFRLVEKRLRVVRVEINYNQAAIKILVTNLLTGINQIEFYNIQINQTFMTFSYPGYIYFSKERQIYI